MKKSIFTTIVALVMSFVCLVGCGQPEVENNTAELPTGGILVVSVNPEIAVEYDENGLVTGVTARNDDAISIISGCEGLIGKATREVVSILVKSIGEAGYFVEEVEGERRQITLEIEEGSKLPHDAFLDEVIEDVRDCVNENKWGVSMEVENESDYGMSDYVDTDYGPGNDGATDYDDGKSDYKAPATTNKKPAATDYDDAKSDYNDAKSDYNDAKSDYNDAATDYDDAKSDYDDNSNYGNSDYDD